MKHRLLATPHLAWAKRKISWLLVAHACNPSYSGDRDQEGHGSKPIPGKQFKRPNPKKTHHKKVLVDWFKKVLSSSLSIEEKKKKRGR
jgi:hypothetical protein